MKSFKRKPTSPGEILNKEFLKPLKISQTTLAKHIDCDVKVINRIINEKSSLTADIAVKLSAALNTTAEFWLNAQKEVDLFIAAKKIKKLPTRIYAAKTKRLKIA